MVGFHSRPLCGGDVTKAGFMDRVDGQVDLTVAVDDVVIESGKNEVKALQQVGRAVFEGSERTVSGKRRRPYSTAAFTVRG